MSFEKPGTAAQSGARNGAAAGAARRTASSVIIGREYRPEGVGMAPDLTRRGFLRLGAGAGAVGASPRLLRAEAAAPGKSVVSLVRGEDRRRIVREALALVEDQILPVLRQKKYVVIKPNLVSTIQQLATTHTDTLHGVLDFLGPRFKGPVVIAESSAGNTYQEFEQFGYPKVAPGQAGWQILQLSMRRAQRA